MSVVAVDSLCRSTSQYLNPEQIQAIRRAYEFGAKAHNGQWRATGEPYISHPLAVAQILAEMHMDHQTLVAAVLHDVIEDTVVCKETVSQQFGAEVAELVDGVSKLTQMEFESYAEQQAQNFRKMLMAMTNDIRVIMVKLADRLHNMRTIAPLAPKKRRLIARETLDIYAPIAQRLGMNEMRLELEDLGFRTLYPRRYHTLQFEVKKVRGNRKEIVETITSAMKRRLRQEKLTSSVYGREKHLYSIYRKMREKHLTFSEVLDVYGFRIIVDTVDTCYRVLGVIHNLYKPVPGKFKDYIAIPKINGYQSLHTVLFGPYGVPIEVQIRTREMDRVAEKGIAAHWLYKADDDASNGAQKRAREWLKSVLVLQREAGNPEEFLEHVKVDLFPYDIYVFTPKGDIREMPRGATAVDYAYSVHTDIGNSCVAVRINRRLAPLSTVLQTGETVEIITAPGARPNPSWLNFVVTGKARSHIRHFLKNLRKDEAGNLGRRMLNRELETFGLNLETMDETLLRNVLDELKLKELEELLADIGLGKRLAPIVARYFLPDEDGVGKTNVKTGNSTPLLIKGTEGMVVSFPKCCHPIPGDPILGLISSGRGIVVHHRACKNLNEFRKHPEKWVDVEWAKDIDSEFFAEIKLNITNQRGALATIAATLADQGANIEDVEMAERDARYATLRFVIAVKDRQHLAQIIRTVRSIKAVTRVSRTKG